MAPFATDARLSHPDVAPARSVWPIVAGLFVVALGVRLGGILLEDMLRLGGHVAERYAEIARSIVAGNGFSTPTGTPNTFEPPVYPYLLSAIFAVFGENHTAVKVVQAVIDSSTAVLVFFVARVVFSDRAAAVLAGVLYAFYPMAVYSVADVAPETVFTFLLTLSILALLAGVRTDRARYYVGAGLLLGITTLTRTTTLYFVPFLLVVLLVIEVATRSRLARRQIARVATVVLPTFVLAVLPWTVRNYAVSGKFIPVAVMGYGEVFLQGSSEEFLTIDDKLANYPAYFERLEAKGIERPRNGTPKDWNDYAMRAGWERYREKWQSGGVLSLGKLFGYKFLRLWYSTESGANHGKILLVNVPILVLAIAGMIAAARRRVPLVMQLPIYALVLFFIALHIVTLPLHRYMAPVMSYLIAYAAFFLAQLRLVRAFEPRLARGAAPSLSTSATVERG